MGKGIQGEYSYSNEAFIFRYIITVIVVDDFFNTELLWINDNVHQVKISTE